MTMNSTMDLFSLKGRVALVTGGTRGLGFAIATALGDAGAHVIITSEDAAALPPAVQSLSGNGISAQGRCCDVADEDGQAALVREIETAHGRLDILVCNAGIGGNPGPFADIGIADFDRVIRINLRAAAQLAALSYSLLTKGTDPSVIFISSIAGVRGNALINSYALSKAALAQLARNLAVQWGPAGIRANAIAPGLIDTDLAASMKADEAFMARRMGMTPLRRMGQAYEIGAAALFLASRAGGFVTGQQIIVDGGTTITDGS